MKEHFTLRYSLTEDNDSVMELDLSFDNPTDEVLVKRIQAWLTVIGKTNIQITLSNKRENERDKTEELINSDLD
jgi:hypothetical protein